VCLGGRREGWDNIEVGSAKRPAVMWTAEEKSRDSIRMASLHGVVFVSPQLSLSFPILVWKKELIAVAFTVMRWEAQNVGQDTRSEAEAT